MNATQTQITWHGKPGWRNNGHEIEYGESPTGVEQFGFAVNYYFSVCGHRDDDPRFRVWVYCHKGYKHLGPEDGFDSAEDAKAFADSWTDDTPEPTR